MSRFFDGVNDEVNWTLGSVVGTGAITVAVLAKYAGASSSWGSMVNFVNGAENQMEFTRRGTADTLNMNMENESAMSDGPGWTSADAWTLVAVAKASGSATPNFTRYPIGGAVNHAAGSAALNNSQTVGAIEFGQINLADHFLGYVAAIGIWDVALSQADRESLVTTMTRANWLSKTPKFLTDELDAFATDYAGTSTRTLLTGTADDADDPTGWASWAAPAAEKQSFYMSRRRAVSR